MDFSSLLESSLHTLHSLCQVQTNYGPDLNSLPLGTKVGVSVDSSNCLHLHINGVDQGVAAQGIPSTCHAVVDLYGQCYQVSEDVMSSRRTVFYLIFVEQGNFAVI